MSMNYTNKPSARADQLIRSAERQLFKETGIERIRSAQVKALASAVADELEVLDERMRKLEERNDRVNVTR